jgi:hypothetical protein
MDLPVLAGATGRADPPTATSSRAAPRVDARLAGQAGAWVVLLGNLITTLGISWDVEWHVQVGPDTFFTHSHLALYSGTALSGIASLVMVLLATSAQRAGDPMPRSVGGTPVRVFGGTFTAPLGYLISGIGAASFLLYGLLDLQWHSIYGFDAVLNTPSHVALFLSITLTMIGSIIVFAAARERPWGQIGLLLAIPVLITFAPISANGLSNVSLPFDPVTASVIFVATILIMVGPSVLRRPGAAIAIAAVLGILQAFLWWFSPWAAHTYASSVGLPLRDGLSSQPPTVPSGIPMFLIVAAVVVEVARWLIRSRDLNARKVMLLTGTVAGLLIAASIPLQTALTDPGSQLTTQDTVTIIALGLPLGALAGYLTGPFTIMLRGLAPTPAEAR